MKQMTCAQLGGACDTMITGNTPEEMGENSKKHAMKMVQQGNAQHIAAMNKMRSMSPEQFQTFWADFQKRFQEAQGA